MNTENNILTLVRIATISDITALTPLMNQLGYPTCQEDLQKRFKKFEKKDGHGVAVAILTEKVIGLVAWSASPVFVLDKVRFHIEALVVDEKYRGCGVGKKLILFVENIAREFSPAIIDLTSGLRRAKDGSHEFYKSLGYQNDGPMAKLYLRKEL